MAEPIDDPRPPVVAHQVSGWRVAAIWMLAAIIKLWCRTVRFELSGEDRAVAAYPGAIIGLIWHNRLFFVPWTLRKVRPGRTVVGLVSASRDGASLAKLFEFIGMTSVRGSSSRMGREALHAMIAVQRLGHDAAITPDGPRGPRYEVKAGAVLSSRRSGSPLLLIGVHYRRMWELRSWDRFQLPVPFTRARVRCEIIQPHELPRGEEALGFIRERMLVLNGDAAPPAVR